MVQGSSRNQRNPLTWTQPLNRNLNNLGIHSRFKAYVKVYCVFRVSQLRTHLGLALNLEESLGLVHNSEFGLVKLKNMETPVDFIY